MKVLVAIIVIGSLHGCAVMKQTHSFEDRSWGWDRIRWETPDAQICATIYFSESNGYWVGHAYNDDSVEHHFDDEQSAREWVDLWCKP